MGESKARIRISYYREVSEKIFLSISPEESGEVLRRNGEILIKLKANTPNRLLGKINSCLESIIVSENVLGGICFEKGEEKGE